jgi:N6-adenosine-specific RNA methylase IME4
MLIMWVPKSRVVRVSVMLDKWGWGPLRTTSMIWLKMQGDKIWTGSGKRLRDQREAILIAVRGRTLWRCRCGGRS